ncbi:hypothetical protein [Chromobacterium subtsugae]|nr:hypothetical protein [Chromobacterium subtsugae]
MTFIFLAGAIATGDHFNTGGFAGALAAAGLSHAVTSAGWTMRQQEDR